MGYVIYLRISIYNQSVKKKILLILILCAIRIVSKFDLIVFVFSSKKALEASVAVRLVSLLLESALLQLLQAVRADKVLRVELFKHRRNAPSFNKNIKKIINKWRPTCVDHHLHHYKIICPSQYKGIYVAHIIHCFLHHHFFLPVIGLWQPAHKDPLLAW